MQGDPLAMPLCALATIPLIKHLSNTSDATQVWYADDAAATGSLSSLRNWWDNLNTSVPAYGYHGNAKKTWLVTKDFCLEMARDIFQDSQSPPKVDHTLALLWDQRSSLTVSSPKMSSNGELARLAAIANSQPHTAYAAYTHGYAHKITYLCRSTPNVEPLQQPLEECVRNLLIPALTGRAPPNNTDRALF